MDISLASADALGRLFTGPGYGVIGRLSNSDRPALFWLLGFVVVIRGF